MSDLKIPVSADDHRQGPADAPITLVEYGDYECPSCGAAQPIVLALLRQRPDEIQFVFRHFPLTQVHPHAAHAAAVAEAAAAQDAFWAMHEALYARQDSLGDRELLDLAEHLQLDTARIARELEAETHQAAVREDFMGGVRSGVNGTPTFFVNGRRFDGALTLEGLDRVIDLAG